MNCNKNEYSMVHVVFSHMISWSHCATRWTQKDLVFLFYPMYKVWGWIGFTSVGWSSVCKQKLKIFVAIQQSQMICYTNMQYSTPQLPVGLFNDSLQNILVAIWICLSFMTGCIMWSLVAGVWVGFRVWFAK